MNRGIVALGSVLVDFPTLLLLYSFSTPGIMAYGFLC